MQRLCLKSDLYTPAKLQEIQQKVSFSLQTKFSSSKDFVHIADYNLISKFNRFFSLFFLISCVFLLLTIVINKQGLGSIISYLANPNNLHKDQTKNVIKC